MSKKKKSVDKLKIHPSGNMVILIEFSEFSTPIEFRITEDVELTLDVMKLLLDRAGPTMPVDTFTKKEEKQITNYVKGK